MKKVLFLFLIIIFLFSAYFIKAESVKQSDIVINEIAWMGTAISVNDEWIELKNNTNQNISLDGWMLRAADGSPEIKLTGSISANGFYLLERTDDNTIPNITADLIYKGALGNNGEDLWLYDGNNNLIDEVNCSAKWFAGTAKPEYKTAERVSSLSSGNEPSNWQTSQNSGGTPRSQNSVGTIKETSVKTVADEKIIATPIKIEPPQTYPTGIILNEILPAPEGTDEENEWVELYNTNDFEVDLSDWRITDTEGSTTNYSLPKNTKILAYGYLVLKRPDTKITLNNAIDGLTLFWPDEKIVDSTTYEKSFVGQSYNRTGTNWQWSTSLTPGTKNIITQNNIAQKGTSSSQAKAGSLPKIKKSGNSKENNTGIAAVSQSTNQEERNKFLASESKNTNPWFLFLTALFITILSVVVVLFIKFKIH